MSDQTKQNLNMSKYTLEQIRYVCQLYDTLQIQYRQEWLGMPARNKTERKAKGRYGRTVIYIGCQLTLARAAYMAKYYETHDVPEYLQVTYA